MPPASVPNSLTRSGSPFAPECQRLALPRFASIAGFCLPAGGAPSQDGLESQHTSPGPYKKWHLRCRACGSALRPPMPAWVFLSTVMTCSSLLPFLSHGPFSVGPISTQANFQANALVFTGKVTQPFPAVFPNKISQAIDCMDIFILFSREGSC